MAEVAQLGRASDSFEGEAEDRTVAGSSPALGINFDAQAIKWVF